MTSFDDIKQQIEKLDNASKFLGRKELKELPSILWEDERIERIVQGLYNKGTGILVATNKRLIFIDKGLIVGLKVEDFPYDKISSIQYKTGILFGSITIFVSGNKAEIEQIDKKQARNFAESIRAKISSESTKINIDDPSLQGNNADPITQLERLAKLKEQGILTEDEFQKQKQKILNS